MEEPSTSPSYTYTSLPSQHFHTHKTKNIIKMNPKFTSFLLLFFFFIFNQNFQTSKAQPNIDGYKCPTTNNQSFYPCQTYVLYRARSPSFLDLASIGDLFSLSRHEIANPNNISLVNTSLIQDQSLLIPISCSCNFINTTFGSISYSPLNYTIRSLDTFWKVSTDYYQNLTTYQSVEVVNPTLVPTQLDIGQVVTFPIFCKCPNQTQRQQNQENFLISYVFQASDNLSAISSRFNTSIQSILDVNGNNPRPSDTIFVPVSRISQISQPAIPPVSSPAPAPPATNATTPRTDDRKGEVIGLGIGVGICGILMVIFCGLWIISRKRLKNRKSEDDKFKDVEKKDSSFYEKKKGTSMKKEAEISLLAEVSDYLDKYKVFGIEELKEATDDFDERLIIQEGSSVYKGCIDGEFYAIKKMKWNAYEELKILQKVNHGNLVRLEGFCIDHEEANCYLVYEYVVNGSLHSWLHQNKKEKPSWKTRLRIAIDVANGLQYIHEHTRPRVVHKDIKSSNILLDSNMRAKIANFGLAKSGCNAITMHIVGTQGYIAPEYLSDGVVSTKMDVYAFGVVLLELVSGKEAIDEGGKVLWAKVDGILEGVKNDEEKVKRLREYWMDKYLLNETISMDGVLNVMNVALACLQKDPSKRPSMVDIVYALCRSDDLFFDVSEEGQGISPRSQVVAR